jgi:hypothetical protein
MSVLIVTAVESGEQAKQPHQMHENVCDATKVYECFYEDVIIEGSIYLDILELFAFPQLKTLEAVVFCTGQGLSVVMSDNIVLNANFLFNKLGTVNLHSGLKRRRGYTWQICPCREIL